MFLIMKDLIRLRRHRKKERNMKMIDEKNKVKNKNKNDNDDNRYRGDGLFINAIVGFDYSVKNKSKDMRNELEFLSQKECEIIMKLRTEYINLNHYLHHIHYHSDGKCQHCGVPETVSHFLLDCPGFKDTALLTLHKNNTDFTIARQQMRKRLKKLAIFFKNNENFKAENLLFPQIWQGRPENNNDFKKNMDKYLKKRVEILKTVINFVNSTRRFKNDFGI